MTLKRLSLSVLRPGESVRATAEPAAAAAGQDGQPAALTRQNVRLVLATRPQVSRLSAVEAVLLGAGAPAGVEPPSVLRGSIVRFMSQGQYRLDHVVGTRLDAGGELVLSLQDFGRPIPLVCLSSTSHLDDDQLFRQHGRDELAALAAGMARSGPAPTRRQLAATCHCLSLGWLWVEQLEELRSAVQRDAGAVAALLDDPAAVAALLPCFQESEGAASGAEASLALAAPAPPLPAVGARPNAAAAGQSQQGRAAVAAAAAGRDGGGAADTRPAAGSQQQHQQRQRQRQEDPQQQDGGPSPPAAKRQRTRRATKESPTQALQLEPGELPPAGEQPRQQQRQQPGAAAQEQQRQQPGAAAQEQQRQQPGAAAQEQQQQARPAVKGQGQKQQALPPAAAAAAGPAGAQSQANQQQRAEQQEALPGHIMPPGSRLESLLLEAVGLLDVQWRGQLRQVGDLGNKLAKLEQTWKQRVPSSCGLARLVLELKRRGLVQAKVRDGNVYVCKLPAPPPPQLNPPPAPLPPMLAPYFTAIPPAFPPNMRYAFQFPG